MNQDEFLIIPDILQNASLELERPWCLKKMRELLVIAYKLTEHPFLRSWKGFSPVDLFEVDNFDAEKFKRFNRTIIERTILQSDYYSQIESEYGVLTMKSKGIELAIINLESFYLTTNKLRNYSDEEFQSQHSSIHYYRLQERAELTSSIIYLLEVCNDMIALTLKHFITAQLNKITSDEEKVKYLLRQKTDFLLTKDQFTEKVFTQLIDIIDIELGYHQKVRDYFDTPAELRSIVSQFFTEKKSRISNSKLLTYLLEEKLDEFCKDLSELVLQLFSYHDIGSQEPEKIYHVFLLGVLNSFKEFYRLESNKEAGLGRFDILLVPETLDYKAVIIEVKRSLSNESEHLNKLLDEAISQIIVNNYSVVLKSQGHQNYLALAAVFHGKNLVIKYQVCDV